MALRTDLVLALRGSPRSFTAWTEAAEPRSCSCRICSCFDENDSVLGSRALLAAGDGPIGGRTGPLHRVERVNEGMLDGRARVGPAAATLTPPVSGPGAKLWRRAACREVNGHGPGAFPRCGERRVLNSAG